MKNLYLFSYEHKPGSGSLSSTDFCKEAVKAGSLPEALVKWMTPTDPNDAEEVKEFLGKIQSLKVEYWCAVS